MARIVSISVPEEQYNLWLEFKKVAEREGGVSKTVLKLISDYIVKHSHGNPSFSLDPWLKSEAFVAFPTLGESPDREYLMKLPRKMLNELIMNAQSYVNTASYLLEKLREHESSHQQCGYTDPSCPYCTPK